MSTVSRTFNVQVPPEIVVAYLADFGHAEEWDPGTVRCERNDDRPVEVGSTWKNTSKIAGISTELTYTLEQLSDHLIVLVGRNKTATSITYTNALQFNGAAKLATLLAKVVFEKLGNDTEKQLKKTLNALHP
jgi:hypothetical protein